MSWYRLLFWLGLTKAPDKKEDNWEVAKKEMATRRFKVQVAIMVIPLLWLIIAAAFGWDWMPPLVALFLGIVISFVLDIVKDVKKLK